MSKSNTPRKFLVYHTNANIRLNIEQACLIMDQAEILIFLKYESMRNISLVGIS